MRNAVERLMVTVDVEAQPPRSPEKPLDRLVWGRFPEGEFGIGAMMSIADRHGVKLTMFLDFAEEYLYGDALLDVGREIHRRGHDLQLHIHQSFLPDSFYAERGIARVLDLNQTGEPAADAFADFLCDRHAFVTGGQAIAFRGGGYLFNGALLTSLGRNGVAIDSSYNPSRATAPLNIGGMPQFRWDSGMIELPISTVYDFLRTRRHFDYNFNSSLLLKAPENEYLDRHDRFLDSFYSQHGEHAVAVLVLHSWSFLELENGIFSRPNPEAPARFERLLAAIASKRKVINSDQFAELANSGTLRIAGPIQFKYEPLTLALPPPKTDDSRSPGSIGGDEPICIICGTKHSAFKDFNGQGRLCSGCGSVERQRVFGTLYLDFMREEFELAGKRVLIVAPSVSEIRFLKAQGVTDIQTLDVRPELKPDTVADVCAMPQVESGQFDAVIASYVFTCVHDLDGCIGELHRILKPGGRLFTSDPLTFGSSTREFAALEDITRWYGRQAYDTYKIGTFRSLGDLDLLRRLERRFVVKTMFGRDAPTGAKIIWHVSIKANDRQLARPIATGAVETEQSSGPSGPGLTDAPALEGGVLRLARPSPLPPVTHCTVCGGALAAVTDGENCPDCGARARTRSLEPVLTHIVGPLIADKAILEFPLLAFAMTTAEHALLKAVFPVFKSASLFGSYSSNHESGVDVRDLSRYPADSFSGAFGILLFDYFQEHEQAIREIYRVLRPGGVLFTHIGAYRLHDGLEPPALDKMIAPRPGYFEYVPKEQGLPSVKVGRRWLVQAMRRAGFDADHTVIEDSGSGKTLDWFVAVKPGASTAETPTATPIQEEAVEASPVGISTPATISLSLPPPTAPIPSNQPVGAAKALSTRIMDWFVATKPAASAREAPPPTPIAIEAGETVVTAIPTPLATSPSSLPSSPAIVSNEKTVGLSKTLSTRVNPEFGFKRVVVTLTIPSVPTIARGADFAEHAYDKKTGAATSSVVAVQKGGVLVSEDLGSHWDYVPLPDTANVRLWNAFSCSTGGHLLQGAGPFSADSPRGEPDFDAPIFVCDAQWKVIDRVHPGKTHWHGSRSVDEADGTIIYAEYPENTVKYLPDFDRRRTELEPLCGSSRVFRSTDGGASWVKVFELGWDIIRHFHTVVADPHEPGAWWLSSGDRPSECRIWRSPDDGDTWQDATASEISISCYPAFSPHRQAVHRHTDLIVLPDQLIWGTDDWLGAPRDIRDGTVTVDQRVGSRLIASPKTMPLQPRVLGYIGNPVRSIIDAGASYILVTEAKQAYLTRPQVYILSKTEPYLLEEIFTLDCFSDNGTGLTYSRASRAQKDGRFFSYRGSRDAMDGGAKILQWDIDYL